MNIAIIGAGGVGGYFGARLAQAGNRVTFVVRGVHGNTIAKNGLQLISPKGDYCVQDAHVVDSPLKIKDADLILLGVKAWQVKEVANQLKEVMTNKTVVIPLQNGVMAAAELLQELSANHVMGGLCNIFSKIKQPGVIEHMSAEPHIIFGELNHSISERAQRIQKCFEEAGIKNKLSANIQADTWKKFMLICLGGLGALTRANYGVLCQTPALKELMVKMLEEIYAVAKAEGIELAEDMKEKTLATTLKFAPSANSSMARDIWAGRPSELEYQNGSVCKLAAKYKMDVPVNYFIYQALLPQENEARNK
jgi:2-dehydropantoate 2-reductase